MSKQMKMTPDFGLVRASTVMLGEQSYRAVVKNSLGKAVFISIDIYNNRDYTTSIADSARDAARRFIDNELHALGAVRYVDGDYEYSYKGPAPFFDQYHIIYRCNNGYWGIVKENYVQPTGNVPREILMQAKALN